MKHVLIVDDEAHITRLVQIHLERRGYRVSMALDGVDGLAIARADAPDLVLTDVIMPRMDGFELLRRLKAEPHTAEIPVVLLSARSRDQDIHEGHRSGAVYYLPKPFTPEELLAVTELGLKLGPARADP